MSNHGGFNRIEERMEVCYETKIIEFWAQNGGFTAVYGNSEGDNQLLNHEFSIWT